MNKINFFNQFCFNISFPLKYVLNNFQITNLNHQKLKENVNFLSNTFLHRLSCSEKSKMIKTSFSFIAFFIQMIFIVKL